ncbi:hypothetical protein LCGC14_0417880 [marine sediment metagenome]|uniref:Uncharacterized protein n=1 Tax=marine sediment metagenome TaxID=412755 RepID=A0A0F9T9U1_9ZZZZ
MNNNLVTSLPLSRKLAAAFKEKGIKPTESEFWWVEGADEWYLEKDAGEVIEAQEQKVNTIPAYLSDELLDGMPLNLEIIRGDRVWGIALTWPKSKSFQDKSLPNTCAELSIWLIDNGYYER